MLSSNRMNGQKPEFAEIREAIFMEIRARGRRLSVDEALEKFSGYGPEAIEVIASLADSGILLRSRQRRNEQEPSPGESLGKSIEGAIQAIVSEVERAVAAGAQKSKSSSGRARDTSLDRDAAPNAEERRSRGKRSPRAFGDRDSGRRAPGRRAPKLFAASFEQYRDSLALKAKKLKKSLISDIVAFAVFTPLVWFLNAKYVPAFSFAPIVSVVWGVGLVEAIVTAFRTARQAAEAEALPDLDKAETEELKAIHKSGDSLVKHFFGALWLPAASFFLSRGLGSGEPWFLIPSAVVAGSFLVRLAVYLARRLPQSRSFFQRLGINRSKKGLAEARKKREAAAGLGVYADIYREAQDAAEDIMEALDTASSGEIRPQLDAYLGQILLLSQTANELDAIVGEIPLTALQKDKAELAAKLETSGSVLRAEYQNNIEEIEKQEESFKALSAQREILHLRLRSSVNQLQQLKLDIARIKVAEAENAADEKASASAFAGLRSRSEELARYIGDLKEGHIEALADPFAELEKRYGNAGDSPDSPGSPSSS